MVVNDFHDYSSFQDQTKSLIYEHRQDQFKKLPPYDKGPVTRNFLIVGFITTSIVSILSIGFGFWILFVNLPKVESELIDPRYIWGFAVTNTKVLRSITLAFNVLVASCTETLGYIHSVSLRWALAEEHQLHHNSNLRLFSRSRTSFSNGFTANFISIISLIVCYGAAANAVGEVTFKAANTKLYYVAINPVSLLAFGLGLALLCIVSGCGWLAGALSGRIYSYNPDPLNTALVCRHHGLLARGWKHRKHYVYFNNPVDFSRPTRLESPQASARQRMPMLRHVTRLLSAMTFLVFGFAVVILIVLVIKKHKQMSGNFTWSFIPDTSEILVSSGSSDTEVDNYNSQLTINALNNLPLSLRLLFPVIWSSFWQSLTTLTFHLAELVVNLRRDEASWRKAASAKPGKKSSGAKFEENALWAAISSKGSMSLFILKPLGQWIYGLGIYSIGFSPLPLLAFSALMGVLSLITWAAVNHRHAGPQPSTFGHLQSLVDLIDDWGEGAVDSGRIWWGDKGFHVDQVSGQWVRRMGTAGHANGVGDIHIGQEYVTI